MFGIEKLFGDVREDIREKEKKDQQEYLGKVIRDMEKIEPKQDDIEEIAGRLQLGSLSENVNWMGIESVGNYISPRGTDNPHMVKITQQNHKGTPTELVNFRCTNAIYSEWVQCLCNSMWHTKHKVLEDEQGNRYPVGQLTNCLCSIRYI